MRVTIEFDDGSTFGAAFQDDTAIEDIAEVIRATLEQQIEPNDPNVPLDSNTE